MTKLFIKDDASVSPAYNFLPHRARILEIAGEEWPQDHDLMITRGYEDVPNGAVGSKHLPPYYAAFDLRTMDLPKEIDKEKLLERIMLRLGKDYYGYYGLRMTEGVEVRWFHIQFNRAAPAKIYKGETQ